MGILLSFLEQSSSFEITTWLSVTQKLCEVQNICLVVWFLVNVYLGHICEQYPIIFVDNVTIQNRNQSRKIF